MKFHIYGNPLITNPRRVKTIPLITLETINYDGGSKRNGCGEWKFVRLPVSSLGHIMRLCFFPPSPFDFILLFFSSSRSFISPILSPSCSSSPVFCRPPNASGNERRTIFLGGGASAADKYGLRAYSEEHPTGFAVSRTA